MKVAQCGGKTIGDCRELRLFRQRADSLQIVFIGESGLSERPTRVRTWALKGCTPLVQFHFNCKHISAVAGLTRSNFLFRVYDGAVKSAQIVEFLNVLRWQLKRKLLIVWDG